MRVSLLPSTIVAGAFVLLMVTGCADMAAVHAEKNAAPKETPIPQYRCPPNGKSTVNPRPPITKGQHTVYVVPDETAPKLYHVVSDGHTLKYVFQCVGPVIFRPDGKRYTFIAEYENEKYVWEFENRQTVVATVAEELGTTWNDWVKYSKDGNYLFTVTYRNDEWQMLYRRDGASGWSPYFALMGAPEAIELLPADDQGHEGFAYWYEDRATRMYIQHWIK